MSHVVFLIIFFMIWSKINSSDPLSQAIGQSNLGIDWVIHKWTEWLSLWLSDHMCIDQDNVVMHFLLIGRPILQNPNACPVTIDDQETRAFSSLFRVKLGHLNLHHWYCSLWVWLSAKLSCQQCQLQLNLDCLDYHCQDFLIIWTCLSGPSISWILISLITWQTQS